MGMLSLSSYEILPIEQFVIAMLTDLTRNKVLPSLYGFDFALKVTGKNQHKAITSLHLK